MQWCCTFCCDIVAFFAVILLQSHSPSPPRCISHYIDLFLVSFMKLLLFLADIHILGIIIALNNCIEQ